jgi:hypothetical protein
VKRSEFFAPAPLLAVAALALNDHLGKPLFHNAVTGKLTDLALCFFAPLLLSALLRPLWPHDRRRLIAAALAVSSLYVLLELSAWADAWLTAAVALFGRPFGFGLQPFTRDPSDLVALAMVPLAVWYGRWRLATPGVQPSRSLRALALGGTLLLLVAESAPPLCDQRSAPVTLHVAGNECGAPGIIVLRGEAYRGDLTAENGEALLGASEGRYNGGACPFRLDRGGWFLRGTSCPAALPDAGASSTDAAGGDTPAPFDATSGGLAVDADSGGGGTRFDGGVGTGAGPASCPEEQRRLCQATLEGGELWLACQGVGPTCRVKLTVVSP